MSYVDVINLVELIWWPLLGAVIAVRSSRATLCWRRLGFVAADCLVLFGLSDGAELWTKVWWAPWWLLLWKGTCITALFGCAVARMWLKRRHSSSPSSQVEVGDAVADGRRRSSSPNGAS